MTLLYLYQKICRGYLGRNKTKARVVQIEELKLNQSMLLRYVLTN